MNVFFIEEQPGRDLNLVTVYGCVWHRNADFVDDDHVRTVKPIIFRLLNWFVFFKLGQVSQFFVFNQ